MTAEKAIAWLKEAERPEGGIAAWQDVNGNFSMPYPEVTGYLIPTLFKYGEDELATRCADWLIKIQFPDGAFMGLDVKKRSFDTSACLEGLRYAFHEIGEHKYDAAAYKARKWLQKQIRPDGAMRVTPDSEETHIYTMRASALIASRAGFDYWLLKNGEWDPRWGIEQRPHYIAYALEGLWNMGEESTVMRILKESRKAIMDVGLFPFWCRTGWVPKEWRTVACTCATAQFAMLYKWACMTEARDLIDMLEKMQADNGGLYHDLRDRRRISWATKFYLDALL